jgi:uncharacterized membrane protein YraQ (UPF0718 family)
MDPLTRVMWLIACLGLAWSLFKDRTRTTRSIRMAGGMMKHLVPQIISILFAIGFLLAWIPPDTIRTTLGNANEGVAVAIAALFGSITLIPAFVAFPLVGSLVHAGASIVPGVAFLTTLTMVGIATFPLEKTAFGTRFALVRNGLSFVFAIIIALVMGVIL